MSGVESTYTDDIVLLSTDGKKKENLNLVHSGLQIKVGTTNRESNRTEITNNRIEGTKTEKFG